MFLFAKENPVTICESFLVVQNNKRFYTRAKKVKNMDFL